MLAHIDPEHSRVALRSRRKAAQDPYAGGLAGTVRAEESEDLSPAHLDGDIIERSQSTEILDKSIGFDQLNAPASD
jgi:hypothetical protein